MNEKHETDIVLRDVSLNRYGHWDDFQYTGSIFNGDMCNSGFIDYELYNIKVLFVI